MSMAKTRMPVGFVRSQLASKVATSAAPSEAGTAVSFQPGTGGTASVSSNRVQPPK